MNDKQLTKEEIDFDDPDREEWANQQDLEDQQQQEEDENEHK